MTIAHYNQHSCQGGGVWVSNFRAPKMNFDPNAIRLIDWLIDYDTLYIFKNVTTLCKAHDHM